MFLVVIVTLVVSILGLFMQVVSLQTARLSASQNGLLQTMVMWHNAAVKQALTTPAFDSVPCQLTSTGQISGLNNCTRGGASVLASGLLPTGYNTANYSFDTAVFNTTSPGGLYVFTYVHDTDGTGNLILPQSGGTVGFSLGDLKTQMSRALPVNLVHGTVTATGTLSVTLKNSSGTISALSYTYSPAILIPIGAVGLFSTAE